MEKRSPRRSAEENEKAARPAAKPFMEGASAELSFNQEMLDILQATRQAWNAALAGKARLSHQEQADVRQAAAAITTVLADTRQLLLGRKPSGTPAAESAGAEFEGIMRHYRGRDSAIAAELETLEQLLHRALTLYRLIGQVFLSEPPQSR